MTTTKTAGPGPLIGACYCVGFLMIAISALDYAATVLPAAWGDAGWRYGAVGLLAGFTLTPLLGGLLLSAAALWGGHRGLLRVVAVVHVVGAAVLLALMAGFSLDALQARKDAAADLQTVTEISTAKALIKLAATVVGLVWVGVAGWRSAGRSAGSADGADSLLVR